MSFLWNPPEKVVPAQKEKCNDGHCYDHHDCVGHVPSRVVVAFTRQNVRDCTINPSRNGSNGNFTGAHYLYGSSAASITLDNISGSFYSDCHAIRYMCVSTCKRAKQAVAGQVPLIVSPP
jgi:hypothetical protein